MATEVTSCYSLRSRTVQGGQSSKNELLRSSSQKKSDNGKRKIYKCPSMVPKKPGEKQRLKKAAASQALFLSNAALSYFNKKVEPDFKYELVETGGQGGASMLKGPIIHINFKAKDIKDPNYPVQTFFAQLRGHMGLVVDCCVPVGRSDQLPAEAEYRGCTFCAEGMVHHPRGGCKYLITGCVQEDVSWLYGDNNDADVDEDDPYGESAAHEARLKLLSSSGKGI